MNKTITRLCLILICGLSFNSFAADPTFYPTFTSISVYWTPAFDAPGDTGSAAIRSVHYRALASPDSIQGKNLEWDSTAVSIGFRGSIVGLTAGTSYRITLKTGAIAFYDTVSTWPEIANITIGSTITPGSIYGSIYNTPTGGTPSAYVLYDFTGDTIDGQNTATRNLTIDVSYIIIRNAYMMRATLDAIVIEAGNGIIFDSCKVTQWGPFGNNVSNGRLIATSGGWTPDSLVISECEFFDPNGRALSWTYGSPGNPTGIVLNGGLNSMVIRYNTFRNTDINYYIEDWIETGPENSFSGGFKDCDIYGNSFANNWDDAIELDGMGQNNRVWANYFEENFICISGASLSMGPTYIWRNIFNTSRHFDDTLVVETSEEWDRGPVYKGGAGPGQAVYNAGWVYFYHNSQLQAPPGVDGYDSLGHKASIGSTGGNIGFRNTVSRNNIWHQNGVSTGIVFQDSASGGIGSTTNSANYDLTTGTYNCCGSGILYNPANDIRNTPIYDPTNTVGEYALVNGSPGEDAGVVLEKMFQLYDNTTPDVGAFERDQPAMLFGHTAFNGSPPSEPQVVSKILIKRVP